MTIYATGGICFNCNHRGWLTKNLDTGVVNLIDCPMCGWFSTNNTWNEDEPIIVARRVDQPH